MQCRFILKSGKLIIFANRVLKNEGKVAVFMVFEIESSLSETMRKLRARMEWSQKQYRLPGTIKSNTNCVLQRICSVYRVYLVKVCAVIFSRLRRRSTAEIQRWSSCQRSALLRFGLFEIQSQARSITCAASHGNGKRHWTATETYLPPQH